jgi:hypothetical protein
MITTYLLLVWSLVAVEPNFRRSIQHHEWRVVYEFQTEKSCQDVGRAMVADETKFKCIPVR